jgi:hypothetical protein
MSETWCSACGGRKYQWCKVCGGKGYVYEGKDEKNCHECSGGKLVCNQCDGKGKVSS